MSLPRILVVGASGRLGRMLQNAWRKGDISLAPLWQHRQPTPGSLHWDPAQGSGALLDEVAAGGPIAAMIVLAGAIPGRGADGDNPAIAEQALAAAHAAGIGRVLLASSSAVYGAHLDRAFAEDDPCRPLNPYGRDKLAMEARGDAWRARGIEVCSLRIGNVAGADALLAWERAAEPKTIDVFADGRGPVRSWVGPESFAHILAELAPSAGPLPPRLNFACDPPLAMDLLAAAAGLRWSPRPAPLGAHAAITLDTRRLRALSPAARAAVPAEALIEQWRRFGAAR